MTVLKYPVIYNRVTSKRLDPEIGQSGVVFLLAESKIFRGDLQFSPVATKIASIRKTSRRAKNAKIKNSSRGHTRGREKEICSTLAQNFNACLIRK